MYMKECIEKCLGGEELTTNEAATALQMIMTNEATEAQIAGLLIALRAKGETVGEIVGFARTMRAMSVKVNVEDPDAIDIVGTGGDGLGTFNVSTVASFVCAGAGVTVAKHGNRSVSSKSGSADVLTALGANIQMSPMKVEYCINKLGVGFLFAPLFHPAMKFAAKPRVELGTRTIFNMLGPITNPASVRRHSIGAFHTSVAEKLARALCQLNAEKACVVHGDDGTDEVTLSSPTKVFEVDRNREMSSYSVSAASFGLQTQPLSSMLGGTKEENAAIAIRVLDMEKCSARDVVVANAALGVYVASKAGTMLEATEMVCESIDSGRARQKLDDFIEFTNRV